MFILLEHRKGVMAVGWLDFILDAPKKAAGAVADSVGLGSSNQEQVRQFENADEARAAGREDLAREFERTGGRSRGRGTRF